MRSTLCAAVAMTLALSLPARADPPKEGSIINVAMASAVICDTRDQVAQIARAGIADGTEAALAVLKSFFVQRNNRGEPRCTIQMLRGTMTIGESVYVGAGIASGQSRHFWAISIAGTVAENYWLLWSEPLSRAPRIDATGSGARWPASRA